MGITSTEPGRKASPCKEKRLAGGQGPASSKTQTQKHTNAFGRWFARTADPDRIERVAATAQSTARYAGKTDIGRRPRHAGSVSAANAKQSDVQHDGRSDDDGEDIMSMRGCNDDDRDDEDDDDDADDGNESEEADDAEAISICQSCNQ